MSERPARKVVTFETQFGTRSVPYLNDHRIRGAVVLPSAVYLEMALAAAETVLESGNHVLEDVVFLEPLVIPDEVERTVRVILRVTGAADATFEVISLGSGAHTTSQSTLHAAGRIHRDHDGPALVSQPQNTEAMEFSLYYFGNSTRERVHDRYDLLVRGATFADQNGFAAVWTPERHLHAFGGSYPSPAVLSAALAVLTERVCLRAGSVVLPLQHPIRVAEEWSVVDNLSKGRVAVSFASGWHEDDFVLAPAAYADRKHIMLTRLDVVTRLWRGEPVTLPGVDGKPTDVRLFPLPVQRELPVWLTALASSDTFVTAGEFGVNVLTNLLTQTLEQLATKIRLYREARARCGHDPQRGKVTLLLHTFVGQDFDSVREHVRPAFCNYLRETLEAVPSLAKALGLNVELHTLSEPDVESLLSAAFDRYMDGASLVGTAATCLGVIDRLRAIGVDEVGCFIDFGMDADAVLSSLVHLNNVKELSARRVTTGSTGGAQRSHALTIQHLEEIQAQCDREVSGSEHYRALAQRGLECGPSFRGVTGIRTGGQQAIGRVSLPEALESEAEAYHVHPALLEAGFQVVAAGLPAEGTYLPTNLNRLRVHGRPSGKMWSHALIRQSATQDPQEFTADCRLLDDEGRVVVEATGLHLRRVDGSRHSQDHVQGLVYELTWEPAHRSATSIGFDEPGSWLIFKDRSGLGDDLGKLLRERGEACVMVDAETQPQDLQRILQRQSESHVRFPPWRGVVFLCGLSTAPPELTSPATLVDAEALGCGTLLELLRQLASRGVSPAPRLFLITRWAQVVNGKPGPISIAQAPIWGLGRVIALEHPELRCARIDVDNAAGAAAAGQLSEELWSQSNEDQVAFRDGARYVLRLRRSSALDTRNSSDSRSGGNEIEPFTLHADATYLITGGHGALGLLVARWMIERGARHLALVGRSEPTGLVRDRIVGLRELGAEIRSVQTDVSLESDVADLLATLRKLMPPLRGIVHAAAVIQDRVLLQLDRERLALVMRPKVLGAWNLHALTLAAPLDFFVLFSSAASVFGSPGQGNYVAANAFLDAFCHYRRALGLPALTINWGRWSTGGGQHSEIEERLAARGMHTLKPEEAFQVLDDLLASDRSHAAVMAVDWSRVSFGDGIHLPVLRDLEPSGSASASRENVVRMRAQERPAWLESLLQAQVARSLRIPVSQIDLGRPLNTLGVDSLVAIEIKSFVELSTGVVLPLATLLRGPSLAELVDTINGELSKSDATPRLSRVAHAIETIEQLSDEDVRRILATGSVESTMERDSQDREEPPA